MVVQIIKRDTIIISNRKNGKLYHIKHINLRIQ
jgi:hypothetical protein